MVLVYSSTGEPVRVGDIVKTFRSDVVQVEGIREPQHEGSTGRVWVRSLYNSTKREYFPGVIDAKWVEGACAPGRAGVR